MSQTRVRIIVDDRPHEVVMTRGEDGLLHVVIDGEEVVIGSVTNAPGLRALEVAVGDERLRVERLDLHRVQVDETVSTFHIEQVQRGTIGAEVPTSGLDVRPPMPGRIVRLDVNEGDAVESGQMIAVLEAMKMQNEVTSPATGVVRKIRTQEGDTVEASTVIMELGPPEQQQEQQTKKVVA